MAQYKNANCVFRLVNPIYDRNPFKVNLFTKQATYKEETVCPRSLRVFNT